MKKKKKKISKIILFLLLLSKSHPIEIVFYDMKNDGDNWMAKC